MNRKYLFWGLILCILFPFSNTAAQVGGNALKFDGVNDYVYVGNGNSLLIHGSLTIEAWLFVNQYPTSGFGDILMRAAPGETEPTNTLYVLGITTSGMADAFHENGAGNDNRATSLTTIRLQSWIHVAVIRDTSAKTYQFFIDGVAESTQNYSNNPTGGQNAVTVIGGTGNTGSTFNGIIDELRIWNVARTQSQIQNDMNRRLTGSEAGLVGYWRFDEGSGNTTGDSSRHGNTGTLFNGPVWVVSTAPITSVEAPCGAPQNVFELKQNYPNPFNPTTTIEFAVFHPEKVVLTIFNSLGQEVTTLVSKKLDPGQYNSEWNSAGFASGVYYYQLRAGDFVQTRKLLLLR